MKALFPLILTTLLLAAYSSALAQAPPPPPPPVPDYNPEGWKEYSFAGDNVRFRFPVPPTPVESTTGTYPTSTYSRVSFMRFALAVTMYPEGFENGIDKKTRLDGAMKGMLNRIKNLEPKILVHQEVSVDGYPARFVKLETNNGLVLRLKFFSAANRLYIGQAIVEKGERHGFNWENDFEIPAMAFLDSLHLITTR